LSFSILMILRAQTIEISADDLKDKIYGGIIGQFFGNLNGLEHENKYTDEPGNVTEYIPDLSDGAFTDDDTDIEFVYIYHMLKTGETMLSYSQIRDLWIENINEHIWCANRYARKLMDIGFDPPYTGRIAYNPWSVFNISGQFLCEQFALISPGMPQTAARIGTHYTHVAVDGEPIQTTQLYTAMISTAFFEYDYIKVIYAGLSAVDPKSEIHKIVSNVIAWYEANPDDWRATRSLIKETYWSGTFDGPGGTNGYRIITSATIASILYGKGDFVEAIRHAFNFGWDADNTAAMVGTIMGIIKGESWIKAQGWNIKDEFRNTRRPGLPANLTITDFAGMHFELAKGIILENGGKQVDKNGKIVYRIFVEKPKNIESLPDPLNRIDELQDEWLPLILKDITGNPIQKARAVYATVCLDLVNEISSVNPENWNNALDEIKPYYNALIEDELWDPRVKEYFYEVIYNGNVQPFGHDL